MKKVKLILAVIGLVIILTGCFVASNLIKKYTPSKERADLNEYFSIEKDDECALIMDMELIGEKALIINDQNYVSIDFVKENIDSRFFYDGEEGKLFYTIPTGSYLVKASEEAYYFDNKKMDWSFGVILIVRQDGAYVNLEYVSLITGITFSKYEEPNRIVMDTTSRQMNVIVAKKDTEIRFRGGVKSEILKDIKEGDEIYLLASGEKWDEVITEDGIRGYVKKKQFLRGSLFKDGEPYNVTVN